MSPRVFFTTMTEINVTLLPVGMNAAWTSLRVLDSTKVSELKQEISRLYSISSRDLSIYYEKTKLHLDDDTLRDFFIQNKSQISFRYAEVNIMISYVTENKTSDLQIAAGEKVSELKQFIEKIYNIAVNDQQLFHGGYELEGHDTLRDSFVRDGSEIQLNAFINISIHIPDRNKSQNYRILAGTKVSELKQKIQTIHKVAPESQSLTVRNNNQELNDNDVLNYSLHNRQIDLQYRKVNIKIYCVTTKGSWNPSVQDGMKISELKLKIIKGFDGVAPADQVLFFNDSKKLEDDLMLRYHLHENCQVKLSYLKCPHSWADWVVHHQPRYYVEGSYERYSGDYYDGNGPRWDPGYWEEGYYWRERHCRYCGEKQRTS